MRILPMMLAGLGAVLLAALLTWWQLTPQSATIGGSFRLIDHHGQTVSERDFYDRYVLLFFGYRSCPDICPFTLQVITQAIEQLGPQDPPSQPVFITIDPQRDTPENLADYVSLFHPNLIGLSGTEEQIAHVARLYGVYYAKVPTETSNMNETMDIHQNPAMSTSPHHDHDHGDSDYLMNHSTFIYLIDPEGRFVQTFSMHTAPQVIVTAIRHHANTS